MEVKIIMGLILCIAIWIVLNVIYEKIRTWKLRVKHEKSKEVFKRLTLYMIIPFISFIGCICLFFIKTEYASILQLLLFVFSTPIISYVIIFIKFIYNTKNT